MVVFKTYLPVYNRSENFMSEKHKTTQTGTGPHSELQCTTVYSWKSICSGKAKSVHFAIPYTDFPLAHREAPMPALVSNAWYKVAADPAWGILQRLIHALLLSLADIPTSVPTPRSALNDPSTNLQFPLHLLSRCLGLLLYSLRIILDLLTQLFRTCLLRPLQRRLVQEDPRTLNSANEEQAEVYTGETISRISVVFDAEICLPFMQTIL